MANMEMLSIALLSLLAAVGSRATSNDIPDDNTYVYGQQWVLLVAGTKGWSSYRHQADIAHSYQIAINNGIPGENIIVMMYNDVVNSTKNPAPGTMINQPDGQDVYGDIIIDYSGEDVTVENFIKILTGDSDGMKGIGSGKVIESTMFDNVFVNLESLGVNGLVVFPSGEFLYGDQLNSALEEMSNNYKFKKMLIYLDSSNSGSMFDGQLPSDKKILAMTASNPREGSYACYCGEESGEYRTCLGNLFSTTWMENINKSLSDKRRAIYKDYEDIRTAVTWSNVMMYGDFGVSLSPFSAFMGNPSDKISHYINYSPKQNVESSKEGASISIDVGLKKKLDVSERLQLQKQILYNRKMRLTVDKVFRQIYKKVVKEWPELADKAGDIQNPAVLQLTANDYPCYRSIVNRISSKCFFIDQDTYALSQLPVFANFCVIDNEIDSKIAQTIDDICSKVKIPKHLE
ncbi:legumain-like [Adelges cooleyi]|uniref:legumain-like n=1 Tax=Adelges cooleyi TaxID=133065 RepID=UPI0021808F64|nr:legumain-like [Adelges cooleyi]